MPNRTVICGPAPRIVPDPARVARCSEIEVVIANTSGSIVYGSLAGPGEVLGFVLRDNEFDKTSLGHIRDRVGKIFAEELRRVFPEKNVWYTPKGSDFTAPNLNSPGHDRDDSGVCLVSYTYVIRSPRVIRMGGPTWLKQWVTHTCEVLVMEPKPPVLLPREEAYSPGIGWEHDRAFWSVDDGGNAAAREHTLDCSAEVELDELNPFRPKELRLNPAAWEAAMLKWSNRRAGELVRSLAGANEPERVER
jgi:hypothetical protein